ncbi:hypothetical protein SDC9_54037 [bioreactor metagenome]|uniref:Uncharacterized protein n=1 Tax=bioreactor metagenome TaxID=1076179 RepID=A0A644WV25_9ZZZZ
MPSKLPVMLTSKEKELRILARKLRRDPNSFKEYKNFSTGYMNGKSLTPKQIQVFTFYTATRVLYYEWWREKESTEIANYLARFLGVAPPPKMVQSIYFKIYGELHPKFSEWMDCGLHIYGKMCGYF